MKVSAKQYAIALYELLADKNESEISGIVKKFVDYIKKAGDTKNIQDIMKQFVKIYNKNNNIVTAQVTTAHELSREQQDKVNEFIASHYGAKKVELENIIDKKIKGGIIVKVDDEVLDGSVLSRLRKITLALAK